VGKGWDRGLNLMALPLKGKIIKILNIV